MELVCQRFPEFAPSELTVFTKVADERPAEDSPECPLELNDVLDIQIPMAGQCAVRVLDRRPTSLTLGTLEGHPECGKITFGSYRNPRGEVIFHIRSRARSSSRKHYLGFLTIGEPMQTNTWTEFVNRVALSVGEGVVSGIHSETSEVHDGTPEMDEGPTFLVQAD
ncbi:MAG: hypothetical protein A2X94_01730 [Bdellovibrionales bacterium GWB1_55_8]|nr:MAG: hypothetical protein A2X94_01730 [Bdellovibrionales bacterium GWB1_55_8]